MKVKLITFAMITAVALSVTSCDPGPECKRWTVQPITVVVNGKVSTTTHMVCVEYGNRG